jgi:hypothetical protein
MKSAGFKDKGNDFLKNLFSPLKMDRRRRRQRRLKKTANFLNKYL